MAEIKKNDLVWVRLKRSPRLAIALAVRSHTADIKLYRPKERCYSSFKETVALRMIERANLSREEIGEIPCGKRILTQQKALEIVAVNLMFPDNPVRRERRVYYCTRCRGYHTTSKAIIPSILYKRLREYPFEPRFTKTHPDSFSYSQVHKWLRDVIGAPVSHRIFDWSLTAFTPSKPESIDRILVDPLSYLQFIYLHFLNERNNRSR